jgi:hypothetical protein
LVHTPPRMELVLVVAGLIFVGALLFLGYWEPEQP